MPETWAERQTGFELGPMGGANTPNLTTGKGGLGSQLTDEDFMRVLRNGGKAGRNFGICYAGTGFLLYERQGPG